MGRFSTLILTIGIPGSGKTTWVKEYKKTHPLTYVVSTDELRKEITGIEQCVDPSQNDMIHNEARKRVKQILEDPNAKGGMGPEIIVDSTNVDLSEWIEYRKLCPSIMMAKVFDISPTQAYYNQQARQREVPFDIIMEKYDTLSKNKEYIKFLFNMIL